MWLKELQMTPKFYTNLFLSLAKSKSNKSTINYNLFG